MLYQLFWALATAVPVMIVISLMRKIVPAKLFAATALIGMSFIYVGFALDENVAADIVFEVIVALLFYFLAIFGYAREPRLIAFGILLHGFWDSVHHFTSAAGDSPQYWPVYCGTIDLIWGLYFFSVFRSHKPIDQVSEINAPTP